MPRSNALYGAQWEALDAALRRHLPDGCSWTQVGGGFFTWLTLPVDATEFAKRAADVGVAVVPGALFYPDGRGERNVRISFSMVDESLIATGVERLASLLH